MIKVTFSIIKMEPDKEPYSPLPFVLLPLKEKCYWCTQNYFMRRMEML